MPGRSPFVIRRTEQERADLEAHTFELHRTSIRHHTPGARDSSEPATLLAHHGRRSRDKRGWQACPHPTSARR